MISNTCTDEKTITLIFTLLAFFRMSDTANHNCVNHGTKTIAMRPNSSEKETFLTNTNKIGNRHLAFQKCNWEVLMTDMTEPRQLLLQPMLVSMPQRSSGVTNKSSFCHFTLSVRMTDSAFRAEWHGGETLPSIPLVVAVDNRNQKLIVQFTRGHMDFNKDCGRMELWISTVVKGYCDKDMLLLGSHCLFVPNIGISIENLTAGSGMTLMRFSSMTDLLKLAQANELRKAKQPYVLPLNLKDPVRVGVFRCPGSAQAFYWMSRNGSCVLEEFKSDLISTDQLRSPMSPSCAFIRVDGNVTSRLDFSDCLQPMRSLLSIPETPQRLTDPCHGWLPCKGANWITEATGTETNENQRLLVYDISILYHNNEASVQLFVHLPASILGILLFIFFVAYAVCFFRNKGKRFFDEKFFGRSQQFINIRFL